MMILKSRDVEEERKEERHDNVQHQEEDGEYVTENKPKRNERKGDTKKE